MANSYTRADIIAAWLFESGALLTQSKGGVDLTGVNTPTEDTTNYKEGSCAMALAAASSQYAKITDANLPTGFPLKSGDATKIITVSCWVRPTTVDANKRVIWSKHKNATGMRSLALVHNSTQIYLRYNSTGTTVTDLSMAFGAMTANRWYHITVSVDGIGVGGTPVYWFRIYDDTGAVWYGKAGVLAAGSLGVGTAEWRIGADDDLAANCYFNGQIDEVMVSNARLHNSEAVAIKGGAFPVTGLNIYDYLYDPGVAADTYNGFSSAAVAFKTLKHPFYPGDIINAVKCVETAQSGTATATTGSVSVTGISGWTPAQYNIIRFDTDPTLYMVKSFAGSTITLYRPYRGTTGGGKVISKLDYITIATQDMNSTATTGTSTNPIVFNGGIDLSSMTQDGFTILGMASLNFAYWISSPTWWIFNRLGFYGVYIFGGNYCGPSNDVFNSFFMFACGGSASNNSNFWSCIFNGPVIEAGTQPWPGAGMFNCIVYDPDIAANVGIGWVGYAHIDTIVYRWRNSGPTGGNPAIILIGQYWGLRFVDPIFDEQGMGGTGPYVQIQNGVGFQHCFCEDVVFENPMIGAGTLFGIYAVNYLFLGEVNFVNVNGVETDQRAYVGQLNSTAFVTVSRDSTIFNGDVAPSVKVVLGGAASFGPFYQCHYLPCDAGVQKTVHAYLRKNSSYGSPGGTNVTPFYFLPFMRVRWTTGTAPNLVRNVADYPMTDVNDTFQLVTANPITPSITGSIIVEIYFNSPNAGAIGWYDNIGAV